MSWFKRKPKIWLVRTRHTNLCWSKAVCAGRPGGEFESLGPFRSEVDAEETCDHLNHAIAGRAFLYRPVGAKEK